VRDLALSLQNPRAVADTCLRYRYEESADLLAYMASKGDLDYAGVLSLARDVLAGTVAPEDAAVRLDVHALDGLVRLIAGLRLLVGDFSEAADLSQVVRLIRGDARLDELSPRIEGQVNLAAGRREHVRTVIDDDEFDDDTEWILSTELAHPANGAPPEESSHWLELFNRRFLEFGLLPIVIRDGTGAPFDRVTVEVPGDRYVDGPLVTVVMSVFKPDHSFRTAVHSLIAQTWRNLEILIFDDCSPSEYDPLLAEVTSLDPRIRFERMAENGGTYVIRNAALARARGAFVAFQDSDDWAHPERIHRQVQPLLDDPELVATHCRCVRVFDDLHTLSVGMNSFRRGEASTVFRREVVIDALGGFDETRKSADNEFYERVEAAFGTDAVVNLPDVLMMTQLTPGSLSRDELKFGWQHPSRAAYVQARGHWHREIMAGRDSPNVVTPGPRKIPAPHYHLTGRPAPAASADVLWIADWRDRIQEQTHQSALVESTAGRWSTFFAHAEEIRHAEKKRRPFCDDLLRLQAAGLTRQVLWPDQTNAAVVIVTDPMLLSLTRPPDDVGIRASRLVLVANSLTTAGDLPYDVLTIQRNAQRMFRAEVDWLPGHAGIAATLSANGAVSVLEPSLVTPPLRVRRRLTSGLRGVDRLVVGVTRPDPDADLARWLPADETLDIRVRWGGTAVRAVPFKHREGWLRFDHSMAEDDFLAQLDVMALVPGSTVAVPGAAYAALAQGVVLLADHAYEPLLGDAAVYAAADGAQVMLKGLLAEPEAVGEQRERGYAFLDSAGDRLSGLITTLAGRDAQ
jgi:glycosyltransferase involved in cell wall biosynthesis